MREYSTPPDRRRSRATGSLTDDIVANAEQHPDAVVVSRDGRPSGRGPASPPRSSSPRSAVRRRGWSPRASRPATGSRCCPKTRYEWTLLDYAIWYAGAVTVPVYETSSAEQVALDPRRLRRPGGRRGDRGARRARARGHRACRPRGRAAVDHRRARRTTGAPWRALADARQDVVDDAVLEDRRAGGRPATTWPRSSTPRAPPGAPRAACSRTATSWSSSRRPPTSSRALFDDRGRLDAAVPAAGPRLRPDHPGRRGQASGSGSATPPTSAASSTTSTTFRPTFVLAVPRVFEKVFNTASQRAAVGGPRPASSTGPPTSRSPTAGRSTAAAPARSCGPSTRCSTGSSTRGSARSLGGSCRYAVSGGAPLGERLGHFFRGIGMPVLEGYGLTETTGGVTVNLPDALRVGTVGRPLPGTRRPGRRRRRAAGPRRPGAAGLLARRRRRPARCSTRRRLAPHRRPRRDRRRGLRPGHRAARRRSSSPPAARTSLPAAARGPAPRPPLVSQCMVVGDGRPYVAALVTLDPEAFAALGRAARQARGRSASPRPRDPELLAEVQAGGRRGQRGRLARPSRSAGSRSCPSDWTEEGGELTPSLKLRRNVVMREFRREIAGPVRRLSRAPGVELRGQHSPNRRTRCPTCGESFTLAVAEATAVILRSGLTSGPRSGTTRESSGSGMGRRTVLLIVAALIAVVGSGMVFLYVQGRRRPGQGAAGAGRGAQGGRPDRARASRWPTPRPPARSSCSTCPTRAAARGCDGLHRRERRASSR